MLLHSRLSHPCLTYGYRQRSVLVQLPGPQSDDQASILVKVGRRIERNKSVTTYSSGNSLSNPVLVRRRRLPLVVFTRAL